MPGHGGPRSQGVLIAREMYVTDPEGISVRQLSKKLKGAGTSYQNLKTCSSKDGWVEQRLKYQQTVAELQRIKSIPEVAKVLELLIKSRLALLNHAARSISEGAANGELMSFGTASTVIMNQGREVLEYLDTAGMGAGAAATPMQILTPEREASILSIPNPADELKKEEDENGDENEQ